MLTRCLRCFYINLPIGGVATSLLAFIAIPEIVKKEVLSVNLIRRVVPNLDLFGFALFAPTAVMFLMALQFGSGNAYAWNSATIVGLFCGSSATVLVFIAWEVKMGGRAMIPGDLLRTRIVWTSCVFGSALISCSVVATNWMPTYFQAVKGEGPTLSGIHLVPTIVSALVFVVVTGALSKYQKLARHQIILLTLPVTKLGYYLPWGVFSGVFAAIGAGLISTWTPSTSAANWIGHQIIFGVGRGAGMQVVSFGGKVDVQVY